MKIKKISKEATELINDYCDLNNLNGRIKEDLKNMINLIINIPRYIEFINDNKLEFIKDTICNYYSVEPLDIYVKKKNGNRVLIRQITHYLARKNTDLSLEMIGNKTGGKDHSTVLNSYRKISELIENPLTPYNKKLAEEIKELNEMLKT